MAQLWEWDAVYPDGSTHGHQTEEAAGIASESAMLEHLKRAFPNLAITSLRRCGPHEPKKDRIGPVHRHAFTYGYWDAAMRELGLMPPLKKASLLDEMKRDRLARVAGLPRNSIRQRRPSILNRA